MSRHATTVVDEGAEVDRTAHIGAFVHVPQNVRISADVVIGDNVVFVAPDEPGKPCNTEIGKSVVIGGGSIIAAGVSIGDNCRLAPGTVVTGSIPPNAIVQGHPQAIIGYADATELTLSGHTPPVGGVERVGVGHVTVHKLPVYSDIRGSLTVGEFERSIPFLPRRYFMVFDVPSRETRGEHAHRECHQFLICVSGSCSVVVDDGQSRSEILLDGPSIGVHLPPMTWGIQYKYSKEAKLLVFASHYYSSEDYIRDYQEFVDLVSK